MIIVIIRGLFIVRDRPRTNAWNAFTPYNDHLQTAALGEQIVCGRALDGVPKG